MLKHNQGAEQGVEPDDQARMDFVEMCRRVKSVKGETPLDLTDVIAVHHGKAS